MDLSNAYFKTNLENTLGSTPNSLVFNTGTNALEKTSFLDKLSGDNFKALGNIGGAVSSIASLFNGINGFMSSRGQLKEMKKQNSLLEQQWRTENKRYNEEKKIRDDANAKINDSAKYFDMPMERN